MSKIEAGCFAKTIPEDKLVHVLRYDGICGGCGKGYWLVEALEHQEVLEQVSFFGDLISITREIQIRAGEEFFCCEAHLRRIDPPPEECPADPISLKTESLV